MFCKYLRTNSDLCHLYHKLIGFKTEMKSVYSAVRTGSLNKTFCALSVKVKEQNISQEQIISFLEFSIFLILLPSGCDWFCLKVSFFILHFR